jgi:transcriptional regulator with XRE-family HTH domain
MKTGDTDMETDEPLIYSGKVLFKLRQNKDWTVRDLSGRSGVSASAISNFEREVRQPQIDILKKLLLALDAPKVLVM